MKLRRGLDDGRVDGEWRSGGRDGVEEGRVDFATREFAHEGRLVQERERSEVDVREKDVDQVEGNFGGEAVKVREEDDRS